ncbi:hypothetical protein [Streptomyces sp. NPDC051219]|uniref:hypothetical protein n=1 Tax=Streptomyces sp. NPDC051219 TaxID=3155283 RepID=UPI00342265F7
MSQQQFDPNYGAQHAAPQPPRRSWVARHKALTAVGAVVAVIAMAGIAGAGGGDTDSRSSSSGSTASKKMDKATGQATQTARKAEKKAAFSGDGDAEVGTDLKPGTYKSSGNDDGMCYWERAKDSKGELDSIIANDNVTGTAYVTVKSTDKIFKSTGCKDWEAVDPKASGIPESAMKGDGGMFKVGTDIAPGTYKSSGNTDDLCYWERAKDSEHSLESIAANDNVSGNAIVTITAKDAYFKTTGCQDWKKTG